jgi:hypothetical protein
MAPPATREAILAEQTLLEGIQGAGLRVVGRHVESAKLTEDAPDRDRFAESAERLEGLAQGEDDLGFMEGVSIVAVRGIHRDSGLVLQREARTGAFHGRVRLEGEGARRGEDLHQERQPGCARGGLRQAGAEGSLRGGRYPLGERCIAAHLPRVEDDRRRARVCAQPEFGLGFARWGMAEQGRDRGRGSPGVVTW